MTRTGYKIMFGLIKEIFIVLLSSIISASDHIKWEPLSNQKCLVQPTLINLHPNECSQEFHYYPFAVKLDLCVGSCNTRNVDVRVKTSYMWERLRLESYYM